MKSYIDFISDIAVNPALLKELEQVAPFSTEHALHRWFTTQGYALGAEEAAMLFQNQGALLEDGEQVKY